MEIGLNGVLIVLVFWLCLTVDRRIRSIEQKLDWLLRQLGATPADLATPPEPSANVREIAARSGDRIAAMRAYRTETGADVRMAKAVVDKLIEESGSPR